MLSLLSKLTGPSRRPVMPKRIIWASFGRLRTAITETWDHQHSSQNVGRRQPPSDPPGPLSEICPRSPVVGDPIKAHVDGINPYPDLACLRYPRSQDEAAMSERGAMRSADIDLRLAVAVIESTECQSLGDCEAPPGGLAALPHTAGRPASAGRNVSPSRPPYSPAGSPSMPPLSVG